MDRKKASDFPPELLNLLDEYVHGQIDRRGFLNGAQKFAVGGVTAAALFEMLKPNYALAEQVAPDDKRIKVSTVTVNTPEGTGKITGQLAIPAGPPATTAPADAATAIRGRVAKYPVVLVIHENRGLNPYIKDVGRRLAVANFISFAPDGLTSVGGYPGDDEAGGTLFRTVDQPKMQNDFVAAAKWLKARPDSNGKLGAVGFCFGGAVVNNLAVTLGPDLNAGVPFYGQPPKAEDVAKIKAPMLIQHGEGDTRLVATWPAYEAALTAAKVTHEGYIYPKAVHGFHNDTTPRYDEAAAKLAWDRTLAWFNKYLRT